MPRFFTDPPQGDTIVITGEDARHIGRSLRMRIGEELILCSGGMEHTGVISKITDTSVECRILNSKPSENEPDIRLCLFQAMPKSDKMDTIIQKAVELGAAEIYPVLTERCVSRPDKASAEKKRVRWQRIALEAAKQSGRAAIPTVGELLDFSECMERMKELDRAFMCYEKGGGSFSAKALEGAESVALLIGSEGGFSEHEADLAIKKGITLAGLGKRILRCETAPVTAVSIIMYLTGNMG